MSKRSDKIATRRAKATRQRVTEGLDRALGLETDCVYTDKRGTCTLKQHTGNHVFPLKETT